MCPLCSYAHPPYGAGNVQQFARVHPKGSSVQPSCHQAYSNSSYPASLLAVGSLNLTSAASEHELDLLSEAADSLPHADCVISTLVSPIHCSSGSTISQALR